MIYNKALHSVKNGNSATPGTPGATTVPTGTTDVVKPSIKMGNLSETVLKNYGGNEELSKTEFNKLKTNDERKKKLLEFANQHVDDYLAGAEKHKEGFNYEDIQKAKDLKEALKTNDFEKVRQQSLKLGWNLEAPLISDEQMKLDAAERLKTGTIANGVYEKRVTPMRKTTYLTKTITTKHLPSAQNKKDAKVADERKGSLGEGDWFDHALTAASVGGAALSAIPEVGVIGGGVTTAADLISDIRHNNPDLVQNLGTNLAFTALPLVGAGALRYIPQAGKLAKVAQGAAKYGKYAGNVAAGAGLVTSGAGVYNTLSKEGAGLSDIKKEDLKNFIASGVALKNIYKTTKGVNALVNQTTREGAGTKVLVDGKVKTISEVIPSEVATKKLGVYATKEAREAAKLETSKKLAEAYNKQYGTKITAADISHKGVTTGDGKMILNETANPVGDNAEKGEKQYELAKNILLDNRKRELLKRIRNAKLKPSSASNPASSEVAAKAPLALPVHQNALPRISSNKEGGILKFQNSGKLPMNDAILAFKNFKNSNGVGNSDKFLNAFSRQIPDVNGKPAFYAPNQGVYFSTADNKVHVIPKKTVNTPTTVAPNLASVLKNKPKNIIGDIAQPENLSTILRKGIVNQSADNVDGTPEQTAINPTMSLDDKSKLSESMGLGKINNTELLNVGTTRSLAENMPSAVDVALGGLKKVGSAIGKGLSKIDPVDLSNTAMALNTYNTNNKIYKTQADALSNPALHTAPSFRNITYFNNNPQLAQESRARANTMGRIQSANTSDSSRAAAISAKAFESGEDTAAKYNMQSAGLINKNIVDQNTANDKTQAGQIATADANKGILEANRKSLAAADVNRLVGNSTVFNNLVTAANINRKQKALDAAKKVQGEFYLNPEFKAAQKAYATSISPEARAAAEEAHAKKLADNPQYKETFEGSQDYKTLIQSQTNAIKGLDI